MDGIYQVSSPIFSPVGGFSQRISFLFACDYMDGIKEWGMKRERCAYSLVIGSVLYSR